MSTSYGEPDLHLLVGAYAVHALDTAEAAGFESHLAGCASCIRELAALRAAAAELGAATDEAPPASLRASVLSAAAATPQLPAAPGSTSPAEPGAATGPADPAGPEVVRLRPARRAGQQLFAVAAATLLVVAGALGWRAATLSHDLDRVQAASAQMSAVLTAPDANKVSGPFAGGGRGTVVASALLDQAVIVTDGLPEAPPGKVYQLWFMSGSGAATPAGFVAPGAGGQVSQPLSGPMGAAAAVGVSIEPAGGSAVPTTTPVLALEL